MNNLNLYIYRCLFLILICSTSCLEPLEWEEAENPSERLVVEGLITSERTVHIVKLSRTQPVIVESLPEMVSGARIIIREGEKEFYLKETAPGIYQTDTLQGEVGKTYHLTIQWNNETYEAFAEMIKASPVEPIKVFPWDNQIQLPPNAEYFQFLYRDNFGASAPYRYKVFSELPENVADYYPPDWEMPDWIKRRLDNQDLKTADSTFYLHPGLEPPAIFAYGETNVSGVTYGSRIVELFYSMTDEHYNYVRAVLSETEWKGLGPFSYISADVPTNLTNEALGFFAASDVLRVEQVVE